VYEQESEVLQTRHSEEGVYDREQFGNDPSKVVAQHSMGASSLGTKSSVGVGASAPPLSVDSDGGALKGCVPVLNTSGGHNAQRYSHHSFVTTDPRRKPDLTRSTSGQSALIDCLTCRRDLSDRISSLLGYYFSRPWVLPLPIKGNGSHSKRPTIK